MIQVLTNAQVFAPEPLGCVDLAVAAGKILWIGKDLSLPDELVTKRVDLAGQRLIPGLVDGHAHITGGGGESGPASRVPAPQLSRYTRAGVTSVVGLLGTDDTTRTTSDLVVTARGLEEQGLSAWCYTGGYHLPPTTLTGSVRGDIVHIDRVIGVGELAISDHRSSHPNVHELLRVASDTHVAGLMTGKAGILHLHLGDDRSGLELVRKALSQTEMPRRVFNPTHINRRTQLFEEAAQLADEGCWVDITAFPVEAEEDAYCAEEALLRYLAAGHPAERVTISSDGGGCLPHFDDEGRVAKMDIGRPIALLECLGRLLDQGQELEQVLPAFTSNPARLLRLAGKGRIAVGNDADLVVLPHQLNGFLDAAGGVKAVMAKGEWHRLDGRQVKAGTFEEPQNSQP